MGRVEYYERMRQLARNKRAQHNLSTTEVSISAVNGIYKDEGIRLDLWDGRLRKVKAAYFWEDGEASVMVKRSLPPVPRLFAQVHELKHHYEDRDHFLLGCCEVTDRSPVIEIAAEEFAAEFIYPVDEFEALLDVMAIRQGNCKPEDVVYFRGACPARISYAFICKRLERLQIIARGEFARVEFQNLQDRLLGVPSFRRRRPSTVLRRPVQRAGLR